MPEVFKVAMLLVCFHGDCTRFESAPYSRDLSQEFCRKMLVHTFQTQVGPYYDKIIDFEKDSPEDIKITYAGCDITQRRPDTDNDWRITPNADPEHIIPDQNDLQWQQEKGQDL